MGHALLEGGFLWKCVWQTTLCLGLGIGASFLFSSRPARAHRVLVLALVAALATPLLSQTVHQFSWGLLRKHSVWPPPPTQTTELAALPQPTDPDTKETISAAPATRRLTVDGKEYDYRSYLGFWPGFSSGTGYPSTAIPVGLTDDDLPVGMQIMGLHMKNLITIDVAEKIAEVLGGFQAPPDYETQPAVAVQGWETY